MTIAEDLTAIETCLQGCWGAVLGQVEDEWGEHNARNLAEAIYAISGDYTSIEASPGGTWQSELDTLEEYLKQCYHAVRSGGGAVPAQPNWQNLEAAIRSITEAYGYIEYLDADGQVATYTITSATELNKLRKADRVIEDWQVMLDNLTISSAQIRKFTFTKNATSVSTRFLYNCTNLTEVGNVQYLSSIQSYFCAACPNLDCPIALGSMLSSIPNGFLEYCTSFNSPISFSGSVKTIGNEFMMGCSSFNQPLPSLLMVTSIGYSFMSRCTSFNQPIALRPSLTAIQSYFLEGCTSFNSPVTLPSQLQVVYINFLRGCANFNQTLNLPSTLGEIQAGFLDNAVSYTQPLSFPAQMTINGSILYGLRDFVGPLTVGEGVTVASSSSTNYSFCVSAEGKNSPAYATGITLTGPGAESLMTALPNGPIGGSAPYDWRNLVLAS